MAHEDSLTEEERIAVLEGAVRSNRLLLLVGAATLALVAFVAIALVVMQLMNPPSSFAAADSYQKIKQEIQQIESNNKDWYEKVETLRLDLNNSQAAVFKTLLAEQEEGYQLHMKALKQGMRDLAHMIPGSRTWLEIYNEQIDKAVALSEARLKKLTQVKTSEQPIIEAVPLPSRPAPINISN